MIQISQKEYDRLKMKGTEFFDINGGHYLIIDGVCVLVNLKVTEWSTKDGDQSEDISAPS